MSFPNIPNITPSISINRTDAINLLLASIALEELSLAHIVNAEAEKIQFVLGTLHGGHRPPFPTLDNLLEIDESVRRTLRDVIKKEILLELKLDEVVHIKDTPCTPDYEE